MKKLNKAVQLTLLLSLTYMISYITRVSYGTVISEIEKNTHIAKSLLAHGLTGSFITYGAGQIFGKAPYFIRTCADNRDEHSDSVLRFSPRAYGHYVH